MSTAANNCADILNTEKAKGKKTNKKKKTYKAAIKLWNTDNMKTHLFCILFLPQCQTSKGLHKNLAILIRKDYFFFIFN